MIENLDPQDREIIEAMMSGATDSEIAEKFEVGEDKIGQLRGHLVNEEASDEAEPVQNEPETAPSDAQTDVAPVEPTDDAVATGTDVSDIEQTETPSDEIVGNVQDTAEAVA